MYWTAPMHGSELAAWRIKCITSYLSVPCTNKWMSELIIRGHCLGLRGWIMRSTMSFTDALSTCAWNEFSWILPMLLTIVKIIVTRCYCCCWCCSEVRIEGELSELIPNNNSNNNHHHRRRRRPRRRHHRHHYRNYNPFIIQTLQHHVHTRIQTETSRNKHKQTNTNIQTQTYKRKQTYTVIQTN